MAKLKGPLISLDAKGTLANQLTFQKRGSGTIARTKPTPTDRKSLAQMNWRHMYQKALALWSALSPTEKAEWKALAAPKNMPGMAYFVSLALKPNPGLYLPLQGGTMQGDINMDSHRILSIAQHLTDIAHPYLPLAGGTMDGNIEMQGYRLRDLPEPADWYEPVIKLQFTAEDLITDLLKRGNLYHAPAVGWDWWATKVGSGNSWGSLFAQHLYTGATNSSSIIQYNLLGGLRAGGNYTYAPFNKRMKVIVTISRDGSTANAKGRFQLKITDALGQLAGVGYGIEIQNLAIYGEGYRTARGTVTLGVTMNEWKFYRVLIDHQPATPKIDFYVDSGSGFPSTPSGSLTDTTYIPQAESAADGRFCFSIEKDAVATNCYLRHTGVWVWTEK